MNEQAASPLDVNMGDIGAALAAAGGQAAGSAEGGPGGVGGSAAGNAPKAGQPPVQSLDFILDIPLKLTVELGRTKVAIRDVLQLAQGSVLELSKFAGEPLEVLVNDKLVARGEVVVVNEKFGIRLTDIISPVERIEQLR
ncbi:MAG: flagellar motor switch protein FliN [Bdellovibrionota bacterium]